MRYVVNTYSHAQIRKMRCRFVQLSVWEVTHHLEGSASYETELGPGDESGQYTWHPVCVGVVVSQEELQWGELWAVVNEVLLYTHSFCHLWIWKQCTSMIVVMGVASRHGKHAVCTTKVDLACIKSSTYTETCMAEILKLDTLRQLTHPIPYSYRPSHLKCETTIHIIKTVFPVQRMPMLWESTVSQLRTYVCTHSKRQRNAKKRNRLTYTVCASITY